MQAIWNGTVVADSEETVVVEGNHYFPPDSVRSDLLRPSTKSTHCAWKGQASYDSLEVDGQVNQDAVWHYPDPSAAAAEIAGRYAFTRSVQVGA